MEDRSSRRLRTLVTQMATMMARSTTRSNQRPDTLMQDRKADRSMKPLATHGRTIHWVRFARGAPSAWTAAYPPIAAMSGG